MKNNDRIEEQSGYSMSLRLRKPELWLYSGTKSNSHAILVEAELTIEKSRHKGSSSMVLSLSDIRAKSKNQDQNSHWILQPCDIEFHRKECIQENEVRVNVVISCVKVYLCVGVVNSIISVSMIIIFFKKIIFKHILINFNSSLKLISILFLDRDWSAAFFSKKRS